MSRRRRGAVWIVAGAAFCGVACSLAVSLDGLTGGPGDGGADTTPAGDGSTVDGPTDAGPVSDAPIDAPPSTVDGGCPDAPGPPMVPVDDFCIDSTEVTQTDYQAFLAAKNGATSGQPSACAWNTSFVPTAGWPPSTTTSALPVSFVDWCDAYAYCAWAGKRLCGGRDGGTVAYTDFDSPMQSRWFAACSHEGSQAYPYGQTYDPAACVMGIDGGLPTNVKSKPTCQGGYPGIFDMSGNVEEWEDSCRAAADGGPKLDTCHVRGGAADDDLVASACNGTNYAQRVYTSVHKGIRCCWP